MDESTQPGDVAASRRSPSSLLLALGVVATGLILIFTVGTTRPETPATPTPAAPATTQPLAPPPGATAPHAAVAAPADRPRASDIAELDTWAKNLAPATKLARPVLVAYGRAEMWLRDEAPGCHLSWATLAGIGQAEAAGAGPLPVRQDIWQHYGARAVADGKPADTTSPDDAAYTMGRYLCSSGADLATADGWWPTILNYTQSVPDAREIFDDADRFATAR
ncbi:lytic transglycosylase domain-containing protein [Amycolatopsis acidicola]|uniref:Lytic transglycosylase domain-containing protein n=1 Tax=Amycolatopsis acidicola TaxID=2596893 RepID=A0A5N0UXK3_9PSEU|nr:lytic transglycosylase domain-containing protein [Amycolatopsis acidicola]KAA9157084.1 lytic transglycosylase domain-containing protein [Amycolatopsis acidicola]